MKPQVSLIIINSELETYQCNECKKQISLGTPCYIDNKTADKFCSWECLGTDHEDYDNKG